MLDHGCASSLDDVVAANWVREVAPLARRLVNWRAPIVGADLDVQAVGVGERDGLYGPLMLTWFQDRTAEPKIFYLKEHAIYLQLASRCFDYFLDCAETCRLALSDGSRMRIAVTNDVLQVMTPTPPGAYSMIRHHALMFLAATLWLPKEQRQRWLHIYGRSLAAVRQELVTASDLSALLRDVESRAFAVFRAARLPPGEVPDELLGRMTGQEIRDVGEYMIYCNAAVGLLAARLDRARARGWSEDAWLAREVEEYRSDYYLYDDIDNLRSVDDRETERSRQARGESDTEGNR